MKYSIRLQPAALDDLEQAYLNAAVGWQLAKQSWQVVKLDKKLLVFPLMSGIACELELSP